MSTPGEGDFGDYGKSAYDDPKPTNGTALMTSEQIKREREVFDEARSLARAQGNAKMEQSWQRVGRVFPYAVAIVCLLFVVTIFFGAFRIWADMWVATHWW